MARHPSSRPIKKHRSYTVDEAAKALGVHKGTVRRWQKTGLPSLTDQRPALILGAELIAFLDERKPKRQHCALHQAYCLSCRAPRDAALGEVDFILHASGAGMMQALCAECETVMNKRVPIARIPELQAKLAVTIRQAPEPISESHSPCLNDQLKEAR
ncbi:helix-turn-helix domain-containing protein [Aurantimonas sp. 22II-16-19i]|uniref:helix-turn-helix domain-containing protein n=1 Tax=Aurantimonas sp. 22II-16-19i TaxID=1317114 RepID=UPI0009F7B2C9|nr:helix-turn-helix domain-containing protein [Aurantimonas sp. 22II-16-19i]ORE90870.1 hypothetical protein ATO4_20489 [Aurantimonas sp. 22II-16-19i]